MPIDPDNIPPTSSDESLFIDPLDAHLTIESVAAVADIETDRFGSVVRTDRDLLATSLDRYDIVTNKPEAVGGVGEILSVLDRKLHRIVAMKQLLPDFADSLYWRRRFCQEAAINAYLDRNLGVIPVHDIGEWPNGRPFFTMPLIRSRMEDGPPARAGEELNFGWQPFSQAIRLFHNQLRRADSTPAVEREQRRALKRLVKSLKFACITMHTVHRQGVVHLDLKPGNIMLTEHRSACWVLDWGLAACLKDYDPGLKSVSAERQHCRVDWTLELPNKPFENFERKLNPQGFGTSSFMCPELAMGDYDNIGLAADIFCLGGILYAILTGQPPFFAANVSDTLALARACDIPPVTREPYASGLRRDVDHLERVCRKAMSREPGDRYISAYEMYNEIKF